MSNVIKLIETAQKGNQQSMESLLQMFKPKVTAICREYFLVGAAFDDLIQEGMIGLYKAINAYDTSKTNFSSFASVCIHRQLQNAVKNANRKKNNPLNTYVPLNYEDTEEENPHLLIVDEGSDIEQNYIDKELTAIVITKVKDLLTSEQFNLLKMFLKGESYANMAKALGVSEKKVDNILQAIKKKLRKIEGEI